MASPKFDGWKNVLSNLGTPGKDYRQSTLFERRVDFSATEIESLYAQSPIFARIVDAPPEHAVRRWINVEGGEGTGPDFGQKVLDILTELDAENKICDLMKFSRLYGGSAILIGANDGLSMEMPLDLDRIQSIDHLNVVTRHEIFQGPLDMDVTSPNFRNPLWFAFQPENGGVAQFDGPRIHHSRVICLKGILVHTRGKQPDEDWGEPIINRVYDSVRRFETVFDYAESVFKDMNQGVIQIDGLNQMLKSEAGNELILKRLQLINLTASMFNAVVVDANENYERKSAAIQGLSDIIIRVMDELATVAEMPPSILYGAPPLGLSTDDKSGRITFYDSIANKQRRLLRKPIKRIIDALLHAKEGPTEGQVPEKWSFDFLPLDEPSDNDRIAMRKTQAETDKMYVESGVLSPEEVRTRIENDPTAPYTLDNEQFETDKNERAAQQEAQLEAMRQSPNQEDESEDDREEDRDNR